MLKMWPPVKENTSGSFSQISLFSKGVRWNDDDGIFSSRGKRYTDFKLQHPAAFKHPEDIKNDLQMFM